MTPCGRPAAKRTVSSPGFLAMGIRFLCPSCRNKVHVKDRLAGLRGFCPTCGAKVDIPFHSTLPGKSNGARNAGAEPNGIAAAPRTAPSSGALDSAVNREMSISTILPRVGRLVAVHVNQPADPLAGAAGAVWYVVPPEGTEPFGPADSATLNLWLQQGRIVSRSLVWRQDWPEWRKAGTVWSQLALNDVDPQAQRQAERIRGAGAQHAGPQFTSPRVPSGSPQPGTGTTHNSLLSQMHGAAQATAPLGQPISGPHAPGQAAPGHRPAQTQPAQAPNSTALTPLSSRNSPSPSIAGSHAAAAPPTGATGSGPPPEGLYYPQRSQKLYWAIVGVLLVGLIGMSVALFYVLDQMKQHKQQGQPTETAVEATTASDDNATPDSQLPNKQPNGSRPARTANP